VREGGELWDFQGLNRIGNKVQMSLLMRGGRIQGGSKCIAAFGIDLL